MVGPNRRAKSRSFAKPQALLLQYDRVMPHKLYDTLNVPEAAS